MDKVVFHIISRVAWAEAQQGGWYTPDSFTGEGFIHLSKRAQILRPANLLYAGRDDLVLLEIDVSALHADVVYEPGSHGEAEHFPHLYGPMNLDAVVRVIDFPCEPDGSFTLPAAIDTADER